MDAQKRKYNLIQFLINLNDLNLLHQIENLVESYRSKEEDEWSQMSEDQQDGILKGIDQLNRGESFTYQEVRNSIKEKFKI